MSTIPDRINHLLRKYEKNTLTRTEYDELLTLLHHPDFEPILEQHLQASWEPIAIVEETDTTSDVAQVTNWWQGSRRTWFSVAAVIAMTVIGLAWYNVQKQPSILTYSTEFGERKTVLLPDSSEAYLNANTILTWRTDWKKQAKRAVSLQGEAFFKVRKQEGIAFVVATGDVAVTVLGTSFNVRTRRDVTDVYLESGKVDVQVVDSEAEVITMQPGNAIQYAKNGQGVVLECESTLESSAAWVEGILQFENKTFAEVLVQLEELYGKHFELKNPELLQKRIDLSLPYGDWPLLCNALGLIMSIKVEEKGDTIILR